MSGLDGEATPFASAPSYWRLSFDGFEEQDLADRLPTYREAVSEELPPPIPDTPTVTTFEEQRAAQPRLRPEQMVEDVRPQTSTESRAARTKSPHFQSLYFCLLTPSIALILGSLFRYLICDDLF
jgi:hypothetical protein